MSSAEYPFSHSNSIPEHAAGSVPITLSAQEVASLVSMPALLAHLGIVVNERTRRSQCILCGARNSTTFSWREDGRWHCFRCGAGGDKIALVRGVLKCGFREAMQVLSELGGVADPDDVERRGPNLQENRRRLQLDAEIEHFECWRQTHIRRLTSIYRSLSSRAALAHRILLRYPDEELAWRALARFYHSEAQLSRSLDFLTFAKAGVWLDGDSRPPEVFGHWRQRYGAA
jgi:hypothetical protein